VVGALDAGDPDLLALDQPAVAVAAGVGGEVEGVAAGVGLGEREAGLDLAGGQPRQEAPLLLLGAVPGEGQRAEAGGEQVDEGGRGARAGGGEGLQRHGELQQTLPAAAVLLGDGQAEPAPFGEVAVDLLGPAVPGVARVPVLVAVLGGDGGDAVADGLCALRQVEVHRSPPRFGS